MLLFVEHSFLNVRFLKNREPTAKVLIVGEESRQPYMRPPLSKEMWYTDKVEADNNDVK